MYPVDSKQKDGSLTYYPSLSAINALRNQGFFIVRSFEQSFPYFSSTASGAPPSFVLSFVHILETLSAIKQRAFFQ